MSDYHILQLDFDLKTVNVIYHITVPDVGLNSAGISWPAAIVRDLGGADKITSQLPDITSEELALLVSGNKVEMVKTLRFSSVNITDAQRLAEIVADYNDLTTSFIAEKKVKLDFIGYSGDVT